MDPSHPPARVAVIVVPGVGDDAPGSTLDAVSGALVSRSVLEDAERHDLIVSPDGDEVTYRTAWSRLQDRDRSLTVDVYEMCWADLSRFPAGLLRFAYTVYALLLQICTIGLEALRPLCGPMRRADVARRGLVTTGWIVAVPVVATAAILALESTALVIAVTLDGRPALAAVAVGAIGAGAVVGAIWAGRHLTRAGWRWFRPAIAAAVAVLAVAHAAAWIAAEGLRVGLANALVDLVTYPMRIGWIAVAVAAAVTAVALLSTAVRLTGGGLVLERRRTRAAVTAMLTLAIGPLGVAVVNAFVLAGVGALALRLTDGHDWGANAAALHCLDGPGSWAIGTCADAPAPGDWGLRLFTQSLTPLVPVLIAAGSLLALALLAGAIPYLVAVVRSRTERRRPGAASERQGGALSDVLATLTGAGAGGLAVAAVALSAGGVLLGWIGDADTEPPTAGWGASVALVAGALLVGVRALGIDPRRPLGDTSGLLERVRMVLDIPYDIVNYLRVTQPRLGVVAPRQRMLRRYRALLAHIAAGGTDRHRYDALVIAAHSQGTVLTSAVLFGDAARVPAAGPLAAEAPTLAMPARMSLLTAGSPLRQLYGARFPGQYDWLQHDLDTPGRLAPLTDRWVNLYRAGDYVGRTLWAPDPDAPEVWDPERLATERPTPMGPALTEHCLGPGGHTGYWDDPLFGDWLMHLVEHAAGRPSARPGPPPP